MLYFCKDNANERNENLFSNCRVQLILCKDNANERNENLFSNCRVQLILCKNTTFILFYLIILLVFHFFVLTLFQTLII